jgi:hypothetical protein
VDSFLALCSSLSGELPTVVEAAVDYLILSDPTCLETPQLKNAANPPVPPHLSYIQDARTSGTANSDFLTFKEHALDVHELFAASGLKQPAFEQDSTATCRSHWGDHITMNVAPETTFELDRRGRGLCGLGVRPGVMCNSAAQKDPIHQVCDFIWK